MFMKKSSLIMILLMSCLLIFGACSEKESKQDKEDDASSSENEYTSEDAMELIANFAANEFPEVSKDKLGVRLEGEIDVEGETCYSIIVYEKKTDQDLTLAFYAVKKDGTNFYKLNIETDEYEVGAQG